MSVVVLEGVGWLVCWFISVVNVELLKNSIECYSSGHTEKSLVYKSSLDYDVFSPLPRKLFPIILGHVLLGRKK